MKEISLLCLCFFKLISGNTSVFYGKNKTVFLLWVILEVVKLHISEVGDKLERYELRNHYCINNLMKNFLSSPTK